MQERESHSSGRRKAVFFDRDGVVNVSPGGGYVSTWKDFRFTPGIDEVLWLCRLRGFLTVLITNQRGVFTGETSLDDLHEIHHRMQSALAKKRSAFDAIYMATGDRDDPRRKPAATMFQEAAAELGLDLSGSVMVGDHDRDIEAARASGLSTAVRYLGAHPVGVEADHTVASAGELLALLEKVLVP
ncbi:D-glycero-beta-D-manno-heptose 1,7-bisphosphate 7-phosphatase [soil metagenome]